LSTDNLQLGKKKKKAKRRYRFRAFTDICSYIWRLDIMSIPM